MKSLYQTEIFHEHDHQLLMNDTDFKVFMLNSPKTFRSILIDTSLFLLLFLISFSLRLYKNEIPNRNAFDEKYFGNFTAYYMNRTYFFDIHPPFGKLFLYFHANFIGFKCKDGYPIEEDFHEPCGHERLRTVVAFYSSLCSPIAYLLLLNLQCTRIASFLGGLLIAFEDILIMEGRFVLTDGILHFLIITTIYFSVKYLKTPSKMSNIYYILMCVFIALSGSVKKTAWFLFIIGLLVIFLKLLFNNLTISLDLFKKLFIRFMIMMTIFVILYFSFFVIHIQLTPLFSVKFSKYILMPRPNKIDEWNEYQKKSIFERIFDLMIKMNHISMNMECQGGSSSRWWMWPLMDYGFINFADGIKLHINIFNMIFILFSLILSLFVIYRIYLSDSSSDFKTKMDYVPLIIFLLGYASSYFPFAFVTRFTLLYHYCIPHIFGILIAAKLVDIAVKKHKRIGTTLAVVICTCEIAAFVCYSPFIYGFKISKEYEQKLYFKKVWGEVYRDFICNSVIIPTID